MIEYSSLFRRHKFQIGHFPHFRAEARMNETANCHQKKRPLLVPPQAARDIAQYQQAGVFGPTIGGFDTLADKNHKKIDKKLGHEVETGEQLVRLTCDLRLVNA